LFTVVQGFLAMSCRLWFAMLIAHCCNKVKVEDDSPK
jgi:hypothetical protein